LKAKQERLQAFIEEFDITACEEQVETHKSLLKDISIIERNIRSTKMEIANYQNKIDLLHDHEYDPDCEYCSNNQFVKEAEEAKTLVETSRKTLRGFEYDLELINDKKSAINIIYIEAELQDYSVKTREVNTNEVKIKSIRSQISASESKKALNEKEIEDIKKKIEHYYENQEAYDNLESLRRDLRAIKLTVDKKQTNLETCNKKVMKLMSEEGTTRRLIEEAKEHIKQIDDAEKEFIAYDLYIQAMHANGVSYQVIKSMLPIINKELSSVLSTIVNFEVFFDNDDNKLEIYIKHPKYAPRPLSMGSGAEKTIASMAIRLALISVTNLPKSELFILDEPATALDEEHMEGFIRLLQMIKRQFKTVLLISHLESLKDIVDKTIDIQKSDGYAHVKI
jgi:exonuclease SbcC